MATFDRFIVLRNPVSTDARKTDKSIHDLQKIAGGKDIIIINTLAGGQVSNAPILQTYSNLLNERSLLCIAGGDGTVNLALNILLNESEVPKAASTTPILPLWAGNANDLAYMLNGSPARTSLAAILHSGKIIAIHPLICKLTYADGNSRTFLASNYASFGASGYAAFGFDKLQFERSLRTRSPMRKFAISRFGLEFVEISRLMMRAPRFRIRENGKDSIIYERVFLNGSRFAKIAAVPLRLTDNRFHRATVGHKSIWTMLFRLAELLQDRAGRRVGSTNDSFTVLDTIWAQFDGESRKVPAGTQVDIAISKRPFYALSTKLRG